MKNLFFCSLLFACLLGFCAALPVKENLPNDDPENVASEYLDLSPMKRFDSFLNGLGHQKRDFDEIGRTNLGFLKRNFDEINRSSFGFHKRDFDEIGRSSFGFAKRRPFDEINRSSFGFVKRRPFLDEISRSSFGFQKKSEDLTPYLLQDYLGNPEGSNKRQFDEINRSAFGFVRRNQEME